MRAKDRISRSRIEVRLRPNLPIPAPILYGSCDRSGRALKWAAGLVHQRALSVIATEQARCRPMSCSTSFPADGQGRGISSGPIVVEVGGHYFHERTKFQAARDRQRDRAMIAEGFRVVRFTGQEVYRAAKACAPEVGRLVE